MQFGMRKRSPTLAHRGRRLYAARDRSGQEAKGPLPKE